MGCNCFKTRKTSEGTAQKTARLARAARQKKVASSGQSTQVPGKQRRVVWARNY